MFIYYILQYHNSFSEITLFIQSQWMSVFCLLTKRDTFLQEMGQPIFERYMEAEERPRAFQELGRLIQMYMKIIDAYKAKVVTWFLYKPKACFVSFNSLRVA